MSVFDLLVQAAGYERRPQSSAAKEIVAPYTWPMWREGKPDWTPSTMAGFAEAGYNTNAVVYACIMRKATSAAFAPLVAYTGQRDEPARVADVHPLAQLLTKPNNFQSWFEYMETLITYLDLDGNVFVYKARAGLGRGPVQALYPLRPDRVRPVPKDRRLLGFVYEPTPGQVETFLADEIIHVRLPNPLDPFEGMGRGASPLTAAAQAVDVDNSATSFLKQFFDNAVVPFGLLKTKQALVDTEVQRIRERLRAQYGGANQWGDVMILDADAEYQRLGLSMQEMTFGDLDARDEARICAVLGVPPIVAGIKVGLDKATYANYESARKSFWEDTLIPNVYRRFEDAFNSALVADFGPGLWVAYDYSNVPALREDALKKWEMAVRAFLGGLATRNEARALVALDQVPPELDGFRAAEQQQIGAPGITQTPPTVAPPLVQGGGKAMPPFGKATRDGNLAVRLAIEQRWIPKLAAALKAQLRLAVPADATAESLRGAEFRLTEGDQAVKDALYQMLREAVTAGIAAGQADIEGLLGVGKAETPPILGVDWSLVNAAALEWVGTYVSELVLELNYVSQKVLFAAIQRWIANGLPLQDLIDELAVDFGAARAERIAATEVTRAYATANLLAWKASGAIEGFSIRTAMDERVCDICGPLGGVVFGEDGPIGTSIADQERRAATARLGEGLIHPGGGGSAARWAGQSFEQPPFHVRCRCWVVPVVSMRE